MKLNDQQIKYFDSNVLKIESKKRDEYIVQVDNLIERLQAKIDEETTFEVKKFIKTGSLVKGTSLKPRDGFAVDADVAVALDVSEASKDDIDSLHKKIRKLLIAIYPQKVETDFEVQPRTLGIEFRVSGLCVDLVPIIPIPSKPGYAWQPSSQGQPPVETNIQGQLDFIKNRRDKDPNYRILVRMLKRWRNTQELSQLGSFAIELILAHLQNTIGVAPNLEEGISRFFLFVAQKQLKTKISFNENGTITSFPNDPVVILDPVNNQNNVTRRITDAERVEIVKKALEAWETISTASHNGYKGETVEFWKNIFGRGFIIE
jgi:tRNA nucleotidyltransferase (CCA-adding enzyme)